MAAVNFGYAAHVASLRGEHLLESRVGSYKANIELTNHNGIIKIVMHVVAFIFELYAVYWVKCSRAEIEKHTVWCYNDCVMQRVFHVNNWEEIPLQNDVAAGALHIYRRNYAIEKAEEREEIIPAIAIEISLKDDSSKKSYEGHECKDKISDALLIIYTGINEPLFGERILENSYWRCDLKLPSAISFITPDSGDPDDSEKLQAVYHYLEYATKNVDQPDLVTDFPLDASYRIIIPALQFLGNLLKGEETFADADRGSEMSYTVKRKY